jgi:HEAT repeat protein
MPLSDYLEELRGTDTQITAAGLGQLSGLTGENEREFQEGWGTIPMARRVEVIERLSELGEESAEMDFHAVFCHALSDEEPAVREHAVNGLWETDDRRTIPYLVDKLENDGVDEVRAAAASVLGHFASLADEGKLVPRDVDRVWTALLASLEDDDEPLLVRRRALEAIAPFRSDEIRSWIEWGFDHQESMLRQSALYAMGRSGDTAWLEIIIGELESDDPGMRFEAANAAREMGEDEPLPQLTELVEDIDSQVSLAALGAIARIGGAQATRILKGYAAGDDPTISEAAQEALEILNAEDAGFSMMEMPTENGEEASDQDDGDDF